MGVQASLLEEVVNKLQSEGYIRISPRIRGTRVTLFSEDLQERKWPM